MALLSRGRRGLGSGTSGLQPWGWGLGKAKRPLTLSPESLGMAHISRGLWGPCPVPWRPSLPEASAECGLLHYHPRHPGCRGHSDTQVAVRAGAGQHRRVPRTLAGLNLTCNCSPWRLPEPRSPPEIKPKTWFWSLAWPAASRH